GTAAGHRGFPAPRPAHNAACAPGDLPAPPRLRRHRGRTAPRSPGAPGPGSTATGPVTRTREAMPPPAAPSTSAVRSATSPYNRPMDLGRLIVIAVLVTIVAFLGSALMQLARQGGDSQKMLRALTWRIALSVGLFLTLLLLWRLGLISPHAGP